MAGWKPAPLEEWPVNKNAFESAAGDGRTSTVGEFFCFLKQSKKWWLLPILIVIGLLLGLSFFAGTGAAPFIYTLF
jgi:hypothetical protein